MAGVLATKTQKNHVQFKLNTPEDPEESGHSSSAAVVVPRGKNPQSQVALGVRMFHVHR